MSTGGLTEKTKRKYGRMLRLLGAAIAIMRVMPYSLTLRAEKRVSDSYFKEADEQDRQYFRDMFDEIYAGYSRGKDLHVERLMRDLGNQEGASASDFRDLAGRVMLLLPEDDGSFPEDLQDERVDVMTDPIIVPGIEGGHLATLIHSDEYIEYIPDLLSDLKERWSVGRICIGLHFRYWIKIFQIKLSTLLISHSLLKSITPVVRRFAYGCIRSTHIGET